MQAAEFPAVIFAATRQLRASGGLVPGQCFKTCSVCSMPKHLVEFQSNPRSLDRKASQCKTCSADQKRRYRDIDPQKRSLQRKAAYCRQRSNPERLSASRRYLKEWKLKKKYGINLDEFEARVKSQDGKCAICRTAFSKICTTQPNVDHDHETGEIRGILCKNCNLALGHLGDTLEGVNRAIKYLKTISERSVPHAAT